MTSLQLPKKMIQTFRFIPRKKGFLQGFITVLSSLVIGVFPPLATIVQAQTVGGISIDQKAAGPNQASLSKSSNNAVIVNIVPANGHGLSHNKYISFSVGRSGAVLNNSLAFSQNETSLGGLLSGNPNLRRSDQLASVILNEVTSDKRSRFYGLLEVAGQQASVIIANPNGIGCNGCGFLNTPHGTLTTGNPIIKGGALQGFDVIQGQVKFGGKKANFSNADVVDVIARSIFLDSQVHGRTLRLLAGRNLTSFSADGDSIEHTALETAAGRPKFGIKTNSIGGMYGDQITMVSTDKGLAVHAYGEIFAGTGGVSLSSDGEIALFKNTQSKGGFSAKSISNRIRFKSVSANGDALIDAKTNALLGSLEVGGDIEVTARKNGLRFNKIAANGSVTLTAKKAVWLNKGEKGLNANIYSGDTVTIAAGTFIGIDRVVAENGVSFLSDRAKAQIIEARKGSVTLTARKKGIEADSILSGENIIIRAQGGNITAGQVP